ncbi:hypothetical protein [Algoriphagus mannitolivorans]|uniref:hypothetical protein n=1 Tax=Algoriphagus mannitolivorans TaxID=226504 RepID=UPI000419C822|nr:hypothetical protein [Algoriphagus mannitolivorans]
MKSFLKNSIFLLMVLSVWACGSNESEKETNLSDGESYSKEISYYQNLIEIGLSKNQAWAKHWGSSVGSFSSSNFQLVFTDSINPMEMPEANPILPSDPLFPYQFPHPEGKGTVDIYLYKVEAQEGLEQPFLNPDSEVIWFKEDGMRERLLFMGPSGMFEDGMWVNAQEFLVLGYFHEDEGYTPMAWIIDVENHIFRQFRLDKVSENYQADSYLDQKLKSVKLS